MIGDSTLLNISVLPQRPEADDWAFVFAGRNTLTSLRGQPGVPWRLEEADALWHLNKALAVPIGYWEGKATWAFSIPEDSHTGVEALSGNLYSLLGRVDDALFHAHGRAYQLLHWRDTHQYCGRCGSPTSIIEHGRAVACGDCSTRVYPRISPCVIVLVSKGDKLLLAAAAGYQKRFYSTLAGFMEPGETCEQTVMREVKEEVGIEVGNIRYFTSQPWPFPSQVMLGFFAEWQSGDIVPNPDEIEEAEWFDRSSLPPTPPNASISGQLIAHFLQAR